MKLSCEKRHFTPQDKWPMLIFIHKQLVKCWQVLWLNNLAINLDIILKCCRVLHHDKPCFMDPPKHSLSKAKVNACR